MNCPKGGAMGEVWAVIVGAVLLMVVYAIASSKIKARKQRELREKTVPFVAEGVQIGVTYNLFLNNGQKFSDVEIVGATDSASGQFSFGSWDGLLVLKRQSGKRIFLRPHAVRCIEEV